MTLGVRAACFVTLALYLAFLFLQVVTVHDGMDPAGSPVCYDFSAYYEAAQFARRGEPARAYDDQAIFAAEQARFPSSTTKLPWNYPPIFQAYLVPWTFLPYVTAFLSWTALMLAAYVAFTRHVVAAPALWPLLLFPGAIINLFLGANGLLVALLVG
ncbi:MAG: hypothetical protein ACREJX_10305, partial [Polyangiaceae bacterium]